MDTSATQELTHQLILTMANTIKDLARIESQTLHHAIRSEPDAATRSALRMAASALSRQANTIGALVNAILHTPAPEEAEPERG